MRPVCPMTRVSLSSILRFGNHYTDCRWQLRTVWNNYQIIELWEWLYGLEATWHIREHELTSQGHLIGSRTISNYKRDKISLSLSLSLSVYMCILKTYMFINGAYIAIIDWCFFLLLDHLRWPGYRRRPRGQWVKEKIPVSRSEFSSLSESWCNNCSKNYQKPIYTCILKLSISFERPLSRKKLEKKYLSWNREIITKRQLEQPGLFRWQQ